MASHGYQLTLLNVPLEIRYVIYEYLRYHVAKPPDICNILEHHYRAGRSHRGPALVEQQAQKLQRSRLPEHDFRITILLVCKQINREVIKFVNGSMNLTAELRTSISGSSVWPTWTHFPILRNREQAIDLTIIYHMHVCQVELDDSNRNMVHLAPVQRPEFLLRNFVEPTRKHTHYNVSLTAERVPRIPIRHITFEFHNRDPYSRDSFLLLLNAILESLISNANHGTFDEYCGELEVKYDGERYSVTEHYRGSTHSPLSQLSSSKRPGLEELMAKIAAIMKKNGVISS